MPDRVAKLALEDGTVFTGRGFGAEGESTGEVVFNTSMTGYQEVLTDPSYKGQIVTMTYPLIGNYGITDEDTESRKPQVEGFITRIAVRSGQEVSRGAVLFVVDSAPQQAALAALQSTRAMRDAELEYARQDAARTKTLYAAGAVSQRDMEQAETAQRTAEAALKAVDEQINQQKSQLNYYTINAPTAGMVGDIPVRQGDRVTTSTVLTTIHENDVLEIYINVPVQQAANLQVGLPVRIVDNQGQALATNPITYVSPTVEPTQTVLAKALWPTLADPSEVENAVLNLAINARDAMPKGGKLLIETHNLSVDEAMARPEPGLRSGAAATTSCRRPVKALPPLGESRARTCSPGSA